MRIINASTLLFLGFFVLWSGCVSEEGETDTAQEPPDSIRQAVEQEIESLNDMRESLAATIDTPAVDKNTFNEVCKPVGQRAQEISNERGWRVQQLAEKYRNPANQLDEEARRLYEQFAESPEQTRTWIETTHDGTDGWRYARRIPVQQSCTACHGPKEERPAFVKEGYPDDRAFGFEEGDLRGIYTVFVPASSD